MKMAVPLTSPGIYSPGDGPAFRVGDKLLLFPRGKDAKARRSQGTGQVLRVVNMSPAPQHYIDLGSTTGRTSNTSTTNAASTVGTKRSLYDLLRVNNLRLVQWRFRPMLDFELEVFQPEQGTFWSVLENSNLRTGFQIPAGASHSAWAEFWQFEDLKTHMRATNPSVTTFGKTPVKMWGWAYMLQPQTIASVREEVNARFPQFKGNYDALGGVKLAETGSQEMAEEEVIMQMIRDGVLRAHYVPVEGSYVG